MEARVSNCCLSTRQFYDQGQALAVSNPWPLDSLAQCILEEIPDSTSSLVSRGLSIYLPPSSALLSVNLTTTFPTVTTSLVLHPQLYPLTSLHLSSILGPTLCPAFLPSHIHPTRVPTLTHLSYTHRHHCSCYCPRRCRVLDRRGTVQGRSCHGRYARGR